jgi:hypothetical protein
MFARRRIAELLAAVWTLRALDAVRSRLAAGELREIALPAPREAAFSGRRGVRLVLALRRASCLESALIRQCFSASTGDRRDVVIGVKRPSDRFGAHAWLDGERDGERFQFEELTRVPPH